MLLQIQDIKILIFVGKLVSNQLSQQHNAKAYKNDNKNYRNTEHKEVLMYATLCFTVRNSYKNTITSKYSKSFNLSRSVSLSPF